MIVKRKKKDKENNTSVVLSLQNNLVRITTALSLSERINESHKTLMFKGFSWE